MPLLLTNVLDRNKRMVTNSPRSRCLPDGASPLLVTNALVTLEWWGGGCILSRPVRRCDGLVILPEIVSVGGPSVTRGVGASPCALIPAGLER